MSTATKCLPKRGRFDPLYSVGIGVVSDTDRLRFGCAARGRGGQASTLELPRREHQALISAKRFSAAADVGLAASGATVHPANPARDGDRWQWVMTWSCTDERRERPARVARSNTPTGLVMPADR
jgi:hypothetical protein